MISGQQMERDMNGDGNDSRPNLGCSDTKMETVAAWTPSWPNLRHFPGTFRLEELSKTMTAL